MGPLPEETGADHETISDIGFRNWHYVVKVRSREAIEDEFADHRIVDPAEEVLVDDDEHLIGRRTPASKSVPIEQKREKGYPACLS